MKLNQLISALLSVIFITMAICPAIAASAPKMQAQDHCSSEKQPTQYPKQTMRGCCDQTLLSVEKVHAPLDDPALILISDISVLSKRILPFTRMELPTVDHYGKHLSKLSILRL